jgi:hypothetical protein
MILWRRPPNYSGKEIMEMQVIDSANQYALRIEGRDWMDDLTLEQVWSTLKSAYQQLQHKQDLLFITLLPSGEMPARCLPKAMFDYCMASPAMLAETLAPVIPATLLHANEPDLAREN